jgi:hypothetical protein
MVIYSVSVFNIHVGHVKEFLNHCETADKTYAKHGDKNLGWWYVEAGAHGGPQIIEISQWNSVDERSAALEKLHHDNEWQKVLAEKAKSVRSIDNYLCVSNSAVPMKQFHSDKKLLLINYKLHASHQTASEKIGAITKMVQDKVGSAATPVALLQPFLFGYHRFLMFWEFPNNKSETVMAFQNFRMDASNRMTLDEAVHSVQTSCMRLLTPIKNW